MGVERVDYYSEDEFRQAQQEEQSYYNSQPQEPDIVPCFKCGGQMYQECHAPEGNICETCQKPESPCCDSPAKDKCDQCQEVGLANPLNGS